MFLSSPPGAQLVADKHFASDDIEAKCVDLKTEWKTLGDAAKERRKLIDLNLNVHQFFHDATEVEGGCGRGCVCTRVRVSACMSARGTRACMEIERQLPDGLVTSVILRGPLSY